MTIYRSRKTLSEQTPNNAYGIPITDKEMHMFMRIIELTEADWFQESIGGRIVNDILSETYSANSHSYINPSASRRKFLPLYLQKLSCCPSGSLFWVNDRTGW